MDSRKMYIHKSYKTLVSFYSLLPDIIHLCLCFVYILFLLLVHLHNVNLGSYDLPICNWLVVHNIAHDIAARFAFDYFDAKV